MRKTVLAALALLISGGPAPAQNFPSHPITIMVPFSAGGPSDAMSRILAERLQRTLRQTILIENVTGAGDSLGSGRLVPPAPDAHTIRFAPLRTTLPTHAIPT